MKGMPVMPADDDLIELARRRRGVECDCEILLPEASAPWWRSPFAIRRMVARPVSAGMLDRCLAGMTAGDSLHDALRALYNSAYRPMRRWWHVRSRASQLVDLDAEHQRMIIATLISAPGLLTAGDPSSPFLLLAPYTTMSTMTGAKGMTIAEAIHTVRTAYGDRWYFNPERWRTYDGTAPAALVWIEAFALRAQGSTGAPTVSATPPVVLPTLPLTPAQRRANLHLN